MDPVSEGNLNDQKTTSHPRRTLGRLELRVRRHAESLLRNVLVARPFGIVEEEPDRDHVRALGDLEGVEALDVLVLGQRTPFRLG